MKNCAECPLQIAVACEIERLEFAQAEVIESMAHTVALAVKINPNIFGAPSQTISQNADRATDNQIESSRLSLVKLLDARPDLSSAYFKNRDMLRKQYTKAERYQTQLIEGCREPAEQRKYLVVGSTILRCTAKPFDRYIASKLYKT